METGFDGFRVFAVTRMFTSDQSVSLLLWQLRTHRGWRWRETVLRRRGRVRFSPVRRPVKPGGWGGGIPLYSCSPRSGHGSGWTADIAFARLRTACTFSRLFAPGKICARDDNARFFSRTMRYYYCYFFFRMHRAISVAHRIAKTLQGLDQGHSPSLSSPRPLPLHTPSLGFTGAHLHPYLYTTL